MLQLFSFHPKQFFYEFQRMVNRQGIDHYDFINNMLCSILFIPFSEERT